MASHYSKPAFAKWDVHYAPGRGYLVISPQGEVRGGPYTSKGSALTNRDAWAARDAVAQKRIMRPCMCCRSLFESEGIHDRLCPSCGSRGDGWNPYGVAPRSGRPR